MPRPPGDIRSLLRGAAVIAALLTMACGGTTEADDGETPAADLQQTLERLVAKHQVAAIAAGVMRGGRLIEQAAAGMADDEAGIPARTDTIFLIASCSKPVVGTLIARLLDERSDLDLDADVNTWLQWPEPLRHPRHPNTPITLRHLVTHRGGIVADGPEDYETYPKPDPDQPLDAYLQSLLAEDDYWLDTAPGAKEEYSNLGTALAALVVEKASGRDFRTFSNEELFGPLGMNDTRWTYGELSASQQKRVARPHDEDLTPYEHYSFNDYPSGALRTTIGDFARWMAMLMADGGDILSSDAVDEFHETPLFINVDGNVFDHSGGESGVTAYFAYDLEGRGIVYFVNTDLDDAATEALEEELTAALAALAGMDL